MTRWIWTGLVMGLAFVPAQAFAQAPAAPPRPPLTLTTTAFPDGGVIPSASGEVYRGPGAPATGPLHHYTFELFALDTKIDVPAGADAWATRTAVYHAMQGHILGKAVYVGLFRRPQ